ncbi:MAG TPA: alpha/beta fold hydrolase [Thermoanaerobaculia bacterium]|nr:alpha/beta fold hydrolase [Thermoanaerobaculia bacterium]
MTEFVPAWFLPGPHLQTVWGRITRPRKSVVFRRESLQTPDGDELLLDHMDGGRQAFHFVLLHGLEGSSYSAYTQGVLGVIARHGYSATAMNFRSCGRDPRNVRRMIPNRRPRLYHSGETGDFDFVLRTLAARMPSTRFLGVGASLGGNVMLKWLGENANTDRLAAAATLSVPYDLGAGADHLDETAIGRFYVNRFLITLKKKCERPEIAARLDMRRVHRSRNFREFDDAATAPLHGFIDANDYYARSSSIHFIDRITTPTLALNAEDDPFVPPGVLPRVRANASRSVEVRTTPCGGHVGFIGGSAPWRCQYWAEELIVRWLLDQANDKASARADAR